MLQGKEKINSVMSAIDALNDVAKDMRGIHEICLVLPECEKEASEAVGLMSGVAYIDASYIEKASELLHKEIGATR